MGVDPSSITKGVIILLFIKNLYNQDIQHCIAGTKMIYTLAYAFKLAHQSLFKLKKYNGLLYNDDHDISEINEITHTHSKKG